MKVLWIVVYFIIPWSSIVSDSNFSLYHTALTHSSLGFAINNQKDSQKVLPVFWFSYLSKTNSIYPILCLQTFQYFKVEDVLYRGLKFSNVQTNFGGNISSGIGYKYFKFLVGYNKKQYPSYHVSTKFQVYKHKSILLRYQENFNKREKRYDLHFLSGNKIKVGFHIGKHFHSDENELTGGIFVSFDLDLWEVGSFINDEGKGVYVSGHLNELTEDYLWSETNPIYRPKIFKPKRSKILHKQYKPKFQKKKRRHYKVYALSIDELLRNNIPISLAIKISKASRNKLRYYQLRKYLPKKIVKKLNRLQYLKNKANK